MPYYAGIDIGSVATKSVILKDDAVIARAKVATSTTPPRDAAAALTEALKIAQIERVEVARICATGYGRRSTDVADETITEITAAAHGAKHDAPHTLALIIDLGGQDTKAISLDDSGLVMDFIMNDKCAAGTGRFLEVMAKILEVSVDQLADLASKAPNAFPLSATCTVFAESEVISLIHRGVSRAEVAASLHAAIAARIASMVGQLRTEGDVAFIGGGARNQAIQFALEDLLRTQLFVPPHPQFCVATGAALIARRHGG
jgi:(R)-2-hydroxyacyl-CoA dehydratese activating ATPase